ncbi:MAG: DivIVA domain-containing protein [Candidatus Amoebophilus sp.]
MQITPAEIRQKNFERKMRGYYIEEVDAFLHALAQAWEQVTTQYKVTKVELEQCKKEIKRLEDLESALLRTIKDAEYTANHIVAQAKQEAELIVQKAHMDAEKLLHEAQKKVQVMEVRSKAEIEYTKTRLEKEVAEMQRVTCDTLQYKANLFQQLQQLAEDILLKCGQAKNVKQSMDV